MYIYWKIIESTWLYIYKKNIIIYIYIIIYTSIYIYYHGTSHPATNQHRALPTLATNEISPCRCPAHLAPAGLGREVGIQGEVPEGPEGLLAASASSWRSPNWPKSLGPKKSNDTICCSKMTGQWCKITFCKQNLIRDIRVPLWFGSKGF